MVDIGLDLHPETFTIEVANARGKVLFERTCETSCENLREAVGAIAGRKRVVLEETELASWAYRVLKPHVAEVIVADPWHNHLIARDEHLDDRRAAHNLGLLLRMGTIHPVHHTDDLERQVFKELVLAYHDAVQESTRCKQRLRAKFTQHGVRCPSRELYGAALREKWAACLPSRGVRDLARVLWEALDQAEARRAQLHARLRRQAQRFEPIRRFLAVPGIGTVRAATFYAIVDTPHRFATRSKLWVYCGVGLAQRTSGRKSQPAHLAERFNRRLKDVLKGAALTAIRGQTNPFAGQYQRLRRKGLRPELAWLTVSRSMASTLWTMWREGTAYRPRQEADPAPWPTTPPRRSRA